MNKYLTFLLILLAATGSEAQSLKSAIAIGGGNLKFEEFLSVDQLRALDPDIMSVLKGFQIQTDKDKSRHPFYNHNFLKATAPFCYEIDNSFMAHEWPKPIVLRLPFAVSSISIRAPSKA